MRVVVPALAMAATIMASATLASPMAANVGAHSIARTGTPSIEVKVPATARYVGGERFTLYGVADCELHLFVEADAKKHVKRLYWIQFEQYLPSLPNNRYTYGESDKPMQLWGARTWVVNGFGRSNQPARAGGDREAINRLLARAGYTQPSTFLQTRMVRLLDDDGTGHGRRELMLIYAEDLSLNGHNYEALGGDGDGTPEWDKLEPTLAAKAAAHFDVKVR